MLVRQLIGPLAGQIVDLPFAVAQACLAAGTAAAPDAPVPKRQRGRPRKPKPSKLTGAASPAAILDE